MTENHLIAWEHETLRVAPHGRLPAEARQAFLDLLPELPSGALSATHDGVRTGSYCGLVQAGDWALEILPKIYGDDTEVSNRGLLIKMLGTCFDLPIWQNGLARSALADDLLMVLIRTFLDEALMQLRQGPLKTYMHLEERLTRPRGRLSLGEQVRRGRAHAHQLHCEFDEFTADNAFNQAVKAALLVAAQRLQTGSPLKTRADHLFVLLGDISGVEVTLADIERLPRDRLTHRYDQLLLLATWLIQLFGPDVHGGLERGLSLLFDMNRLFQEFVSSMLLKAIDRHPHRHRLELTWERPVLALVRDHSGAGRFMMRPDLCLMCDGELIAILDTKWKRLDPRGDEGKAGVMQSDLYQLLAYGHTYRCQRLALVYPFHKELSNWPAPRFRFAPHDETGIALSVTTFDLDQPELAAAGLLHRFANDKFERDALQPA